MRAPAVAITGVVVTIVAIVNCGSDPAEPTQIVVAVDTTPAECKLIQKTLVRVDTFDDHAPSAAEKAGCDQGTSHIGEFVLVPKAADDAEVQFQVVTGVARNPDECHADDSVDCIFVKRVARFVPHQTVRLSVLMSGACRGKTCKPDESCNDQGQCVSATGNADAGATPPVDAGPKTPREKCEASGCLALPSATCTDAGVCEAHCGTAQNCALSCPPGIVCKFSCEKFGACKTVVCEETSPSCEIDCATGNACTTVTCKADNCTISCGEGGDSSRSCQTLNVGSKNTPSITCGDKGCGTLNCTGPAPCDCHDHNPSDCNGTNFLCDSCVSH
jgi:hypothetical protein